MKRTRHHSLRRIRILIDGTSLCVLLHKTKLSDIGLILQGLDLAPATSTRTTSADRSQVNGRLIRFPTRTVAA